MPHNKLILITGCAGFIGSHLAEALLERGDEIVGIDNFDPFYAEQIKRKNIESILDHPSFTFYQESILDEEKLKNIFSSHTVTHVVHLAAKAGVRPSIQQPVLYQKYNVEATSILLECCHSFNIKKIIFASSSSVYGNNQKVPFAENDTVDFPVSPYAATKKAGELLCYTYHHLYDLNVFALRFFTVYGPRQRPEMAIHKFTRLIDQGKPIDVYGFGKPKRDFTYIHDIIQGVVQSIDRVKGYEIINLGESQTISTTELVGLIENALAKKAIKNEMPMQPGDVTQTFADISKAQKLLNYFPETPVEKGIVQFVEWYKTHKHYI
jgi:UDP-glucuronate 4-epimerase